LREADRGWDLLTVALAVYLLTAVGRIHQLFPALGAVKLTAVSAGAACVLILIDARRERRLSAVLRSPAMKAMAAFLFWAALSVPGALWTAKAFDSLVTLSKAIAMSFVMVTAIRGVRDVARLAAAYYAGAVIYSAVVLQQFQLNANDWRLGRLIYYDSNDAALLVVTALPIGLYLILRPGVAWARWLAAAGIPFLGLLLIKCGSRGGFLALVATTVYVLFRFTVVSARLRIAVIGVFSVLFVAFSSSDFWSELAKAGDPSQDYNVNAEVGRMKLWKRGIGYMSEHPMFGLGVDNFDTAEATISPLLKDLPFGKGMPGLLVHNSYVQVGSETGVPGILLFLTMLWLTFSALQAVKRKTARGGIEDESVRFLMRAITAAMIGLAVGMFFLSFAYREVPYSLISLAAALAKVTARRAKVSLARRDRPSAVGSPHAA
jgi:O-antigen ligase